MKIFTKENTSGLGTYEQKPAVTYKYQDTIIRLFRRIIIHLELPFVTETPQIRDLSTAIQSFLIDHFVSFQWYTTAIFIRMIYDSDFYGDTLFLIVIFTVI